MPNKITISLSQQILKFTDTTHQTIQQYPINSAKNGAGEQINSECTPRGKHLIVEKIGENAPVNSVFVARQATGEIYDNNLLQQYPHRDWILTRILRLKGLEKGLNLGGNQDTFDRLIYIHGCPDNIDFSTPMSHGCIRMRNNDIIELFNLVQINDLVIINEN